MKESWVREPQNGVVAAFIYLEKKINAAMPGRGGYRTSERGGGAGGGRGGRGGGGLLKRGAFTHTRSQRFSPLYTVLGSPKRGC